MPSQINSNQKEVYFFYDGQEICYTDDPVVAIQEGGIIQTAVIDEVPNMLGYFQDLKLASLGDLEFNF